MRVAQLIAFLEKCYPEARVTIDVIGTDDNHTCHDIIGIIPKLRFVELVHAAKHELDDDCVV